MGCDASLALDEHTLRKECERRSQQRFYASAYRGAGLIEKHQRVLGECSGMSPDGGESLAVRQIEAGDDSFVAALWHSALWMARSHPGDALFGVGDHVREAFARDA